MRRGFTLIELLVFAAIFTLIMGGLITVLITITRVQSRQGSATEVQSQGQFLLQQIQYYIEGSRLVDMPLDTSSSILKLREATSSYDPTYLTLATGTVYLQQGTSGTLLALTSNKVVVSQLSFTRHYNLSNSSSPYGTDSVSYSFTMAWNASNTTQLYSQTFESAAQVLAPVGKIALVQQAATSTAGAGVTSITTVFPTNNDTSSLLLAVVSNTGTSSAVVTVSSTANGGWTRIASSGYAANNSNELTLFDFLNASNSSNTVTASFDRSVTSPSLFIYEYRGAATSSSLDASSTQQQSSSTAISSGSASPTSSVELLFGVDYSGVSISTAVPTSGTGFTTETSSTVSNTTVEDMNQYITGSVAATWTYSQVTTSTAILVTFK